MLRKNWRDYLVNGDEVEKAYIVFEEPDGKVKFYDLCVGVFSDLEVAKEYANSVHRDENLYITNYSDFVAGNYDYLYTIK